MAVAAAAIALSGCSLRIQAPIREVAYDFSDRDFYDRSYAPSPAYAPSPRASDTMDERVPRGPQGNQAPAPACEGALIGFR